MTDREAVLHQMLQESERVCPAFRTGKFKQPVDGENHARKRHREVSAFSTLTAFPLAGGLVETKKAKPPAPRRKRNFQLILRYRALTRDRGICRLCGIDTMALWCALEYVRRQIEGNRPSWDCEFSSFLFVVGVRASRFPKQLWDVDHIQAVCEGGSDDLANLRTLCLFCHRKVTRELVERRKKAAVGSA